MTYTHLVRIRNGQVPLTEFAAAGIDQAMEWPIGQAWETYTSVSTTWLEERGYELLDEAEHQLWGLWSLPEKERWDYIQQHRAKHHRSSA